MNDPVLAAHFRALFEEYLGKDFEIIPDPEPKDYWVKKTKFNVERLSTPPVFPEPTLKLFRPPRVYLRREVYAIPTSLHGQSEMIDHFRELFAFLLAKRAEDAPGHRRRVGVTDAHVEETDDIKYTMVGYQYTDAFPVDD
jgi:hypothetical protein